MLVIASRSPIKRRVLSSTNRFWSTDDFAAPASTVSHALSELVAGGELRHVRKGLYWRGTRTALGMSPPPAERLVETLVGKAGVGPAGLSAANLLRLSTQVPRYRHVAVPKRPPTGVERVTFHDRTARTGRVRAKLDATEIALLEVLDGWDQLLEVPQDTAWTVLRRLVTERRVRPERLAQAAKTEPARVRGRLEKLLTDNGPQPAAAKMAANGGQRTPAHA